ncbi:hypothetical protein [Lacticaseibacillus daqingensis]|nr:hypothetical protein [Lacticaseibacillus daqingensis]
MQEEQDVVLRQIKAFAQGLGSLLMHGKDGSTTEIVFPPTDATTKKPK